VDGRDWISHHRYRFGSDRVRFNERDHLIIAFLAAIRPARMRCPDCGMKTEKIAQLLSKAPFSKRFEPPPHRT